MVPAGHLLAFSLISLALIVVPGPNVLFIISRSLMLGRAAGVGTAFGGQIGVYVQVAAVPFGVGAVVERSVAVFTVIKLAGAAYLVYLGIQAVRHRRSLAEALGTRSEPKTIRRILRDGFMAGNGLQLVTVSRLPFACTYVRMHWWSPGPIRPAARRTCLGPGRITVGWRPCLCASGRCRLTKAS